MTPSSDPHALDHLGVYESRKSVFYGYAARVENAADVDAFVAAVRDEHPEARHVCYAALFRENGGNDPSTGAESERISDDGEPSGTAGKPILEAIRFSGIQNCAVAVSRKFGGTLLGAGGLVRAYSSAASQALAAAERGYLVRCSQLMITLDYSRLKTLDHLVQTFHGVVADRAYTQNVTSTITVDFDQKQPFCDAVTQAFAGDVTPVDKGIVLTLRPVSKQ